MHKTRSGRDLPLIHSHLPCLTVIRVKRSVLARNAQNVTEPLWHTFSYLNVECQTEDWKVHKRTVCVKGEIWNKTERTLRKISGPNNPMGRLQSMEDNAWAFRRQNPDPNPSHCDGCFRRFRGHPPNEDDIDETGKPYEDCGSVSDGKRCRNCDWVACRDCMRPENQKWSVLAPPTGTCRCLKSNFGVRYCTLTTSYLHGDQKKHYHGDRHPEVSASGYSRSAFEDEPRKCGNCGKVALCLKGEHLKDLSPLIQ
ncbi:hypothetical protein D9758_001350 [Tetrapyrgos nigripes]|uniref:Uncharacterized protein n=1 Tax=Tetrapyrgos nigripes TaxID=182062 RepID=A0A8H5GRS2_9AGAR|nr:hypothetical protein D9758_001350 [Tetrapyrgos nigripes]